MTDPAPTEATERTAAGRPARGSRYPSTALALIGAVLGSLALVAFLVLVVVRPDGMTPPRTDWHEVAGEVTLAYGPHILDPELPEGWSANYARVGTTEEGVTWRVGFLSPDEGFVGLEQSFETDPVAPAALPEELGESSGTLRLDGRIWQVFDRRAEDPSGNYAYGIATELASSTVLLHGSASDDDFLVVASALTAEAER